MNLEPDIIPTLIVNNIEEMVIKSSESVIDKNNTAAEPNLKKAQKNESKIHFAAFEKDLVSGEGDEKTKLRKSSTPFKKIEKLNLQEVKIVPENTRSRRYFIVGIFQVTLCVVMVVCLKLFDIIYSST